MSTKLSTSIFLSNNKKKTLSNDYRKINVLLNEKGFYYLQVLIQLVVAIISICTQIKRIKN